MIQICTGLHGSESSLNGIRVLPQFRVASSHEEVMEAVKKIPDRHRFIGMDFGFEVSYNAVVRMAVDDKNKILYLYWEYYKNHMTDPETAEELQAYGLDRKLIVADSAEPKAMRFYKQTGFRMRGAHKATRLDNTRKIKRFRQIICSPNCPNCIRELSTLTYDKDSKGNLIYDEFNIDPHTFSAIWYGLDTYEVADIKEIPKNSRKGGVA